MKYVSPLSKVFPTLGFHKRSVTEISKLIAGHKDKRKAVYVKKGVAIARYVIKKIRIAPLVNASLQVLCVERSFREAQFDESLDEFEKRTFLLLHQSGQAGAVMLKDTIEPDEDTGVAHRMYTMVIFIDAEPMGCKTFDELQNRMFRTYVIATEFINGYRLFVNAVKRVGVFEDPFAKDVPKERDVNMTYAPDYRFEKSEEEEGPNALIDFYRDSPYDHATQSDVTRLLCSYKSIERVIELVKKELGIYEFEFAHWSEGCRDFYGEVESPFADFIKRYKQVWQEHQRVWFDGVVVRKTWEYFISLECPYLK